LKQRLDQHLTGNPSQGPKDSAFELELRMDATTGYLKPFLRIIDISAVSPTDVAFARSINSAGFVRPPDILMKQPPTEAETVQVFRLSDKQALAFRMIARTLVAEKESGGEEAKVTICLCLEIYQVYPSIPLLQRPPALRLAIFGQAGTGKSEIMRAVIWYALQHGFADTIGTMSAFWRPALMMHKPHTPAASVNTFIGTNPFKLHQTPLGSARSK